MAIDGPDKAIYVADGIRLFLPLLLALSANSPFWRGDRTGMMSTRTPVFRAFPRAGVPPHYGTWETYSNRVEQMMRGGAIEDYTYLWWDVRPHPNLGTVETRIFDQQTTLEHTIALAALTISLAHRFSALYDAEEPLGEFPTELIDDNKVRAALRGMDGTLIDFFRARADAGRADGRDAGRGAKRRRRGSAVARPSSTWSMTSSAERAGRTGSFATGSATTTCRSSSAR